MSAIKSIEYSTNYTWGTGGMPTWTAVDDFTADSLEPGLEDIVSYEMGTGDDKQDGVKLQGEFKAEGANLPVAGTRTWFRFTPYSGTAKVVGGVLGCRVGLGKSSLRPLGSGEPYTLVRFSAAGSVAGDTIEDDQS